MKALVYLRDQFGWLGLAWLRSLLPLFDVHFIAQLIMGNDTGGEYDKVSKVGLFESSL